MLLRAAGEGDLEIGLTSPGSGGDVSPRRRRAVESCLSGKSLDLVMSSSEKRIDLAAGHKKHDKQLTGRHKDSELHFAAQRGDLDAVRKIIAEIDTQMTSTSEEFHGEVPEIRAGAGAAVVNEPNEVGETALFIAAERGYTDIVVELLKHSDKESLARKNMSGLDALHVAAKEGHRGQHCHSQIFQNLP
jgi:ankyrin repeat protein